MQQRTSDVNQLQRRGMRGQILLSSIVVLASVALTACRGEGKENGAHALTSSTDIQSNVLATPEASPVLTVGPVAVASPAAPSPTTLPDDKEDKAETGYYTIQAGDTLSGIAQRLNTTVDELVKANAGVDPKRLQIGQKLVIPSADAAAG